MSYRLVAMDLDETLLSGGYGISNRNYKAIKAAQEKGVKVTIATGRTYKSCLPYAQKLAVDIPFITYHGALVRSLGVEKPLFYNPVDFELAYGIVETAENMGYHINLYIDDRVHIREENNFSRMYQDITAVEVLPVGNLTNFLANEKKAPPKITIIDFEGHLEKIEAFLHEKYREKLTITKSHRYFLEITHLKATKGQALESLAEILNIKRDEVMAFGDSYNDIDMLQYAGMGVAVANAYREVQEKADLITRSNLENGVAEIIEEYII